LAATFLAATLLAAKKVNLLRVELKSLRKFLYVIMTSGELLLNYRRRLSGPLAIATAKVTPNCIRENGPSRKIVPAALLQLTRLFCLPLIQCFCSTFYIEFVQQCSVQIMAEYFSKRVINFTL